MTTTQKIPELFLIRAPGVQGPDTTPLFLGAQCGSLARVSCGKSASGIAPQTCSNTP
ncbi:MAG: hypothetical protein K0R38_564 [Polyangiaceae bacterium]|jgi:hypothetical protein|nr:hypothetical protein [Polyangiaceae bacterium]